jgi:transaldolase
MRAVGGTMKATTRLYEAGQSLWLDNITRALLESGGLARYIADFGITGLTSNPTIFDLAIRGGGEYDAAIRERAPGTSDEDLFLELAVEDLTRAADLFRPVHTTTHGVDGWVSLEVSPKLAYDSERTVTAARELHARARRPNLFIKIPGTPRAFRPSRRRSSPACR